MSFTEKITSIRSDIEDQLDGRNPYDAHELILNAVDFLMEEYADGKRGVHTDPGMLMEELIATALATTSDELSHYELVKAMLEILSSKDDTFVIAFDTLTGGRFCGYLTPHSGDERLNQLVASHRREDGVAKVLWYGGAK
jgi:hypothetical protein